MIKLGRERRADPGDDLVSAAGQRQPRRRGSTDRELGSFFDLLLVAGNETARNAMAHGLKLLTDNPDQRELLLEDFDATSAAPSRRSSATSRRSSSSAGR